MDASQNLEEVKLATVMKFVENVFHSFTLGLDGLRYGLALFGERTEVGYFLFLFFISLSGNRMKTSF